MINELIINKPDDMHLHLREGAILGFVLKDTASQFARAIVMPNLNTPVTSVALAKKYYDSIKSYGYNFEPLMTLYLTDILSKEEIRKAKESKIIQGIKLYPAGVTTNSKNGISSIDSCYNIFEEMEKNDLPLLVHGEVSDPKVDIFDREKMFIDKYLARICKNFPSLKLVFEHISTKDAVEFVINSSSKVAATITPQHAMLSRNDLLSGGIKPHNYCLPILKRETHQKAILEAAISGNSKFFLGTDSAPHITSEKESACGCAGVYSAKTAIELYAEIFDKNDALDKLSDFSNKFGADFYNLPYNKDKIRLIRKERQIPQQLEFLDNQITPFLAGQTINWQIA
ncbi:dihydroorotase [Methylophilaceae bacterium]|jgi:dihydroorotase|nr:dihydroorotase [Methylophilaceae bacterium]